MATRNASSYAASISSSTAYCSLCLQDHNKAALILRYPILQTKRTINIVLMTQSDTMLCTIIQTQSFHYAALLIKL
jgi:hypothetical protein